MVGPFGAFPPVFLVSPGYDLIWGYPFVLSGMQLRGYVGVDGQTHQYFFLEPATICSAVRPLFLVGCSWAATYGWLTRMDGFPGLITIHLSRPS